MALQRLQDYPRLRREIRRVEAGPQAEARAHRRGSAAARAAVAVACRVHVRVVQGLGGEADRMVDLTPLDLVVANQAGQDRQPRRVGRGPAPRPEVVHTEVPDRARAGPPPLSAVLAPRLVQLVEPAAIPVQHEHVTVRGALFDRRVRRDRIALPVGLAPVVEAHGHPPLRCGDGHVGHAEVPDHGPVAAEVVDVRAGSLVHRRPVDPLVPRIVGRKEATRGRIGGRQPDRGRDRRCAGARYEQGPDEGLPGHALARC